MVNEIVRTIDMVMRGSGKPRHRPPTPSSRITSAARRGREVDSRDDWSRDLSESSWLLVLVAVHRAYVWVCAGLRGSR